MEVYGPLEDHAWDPQIRRAEEDDKGLSKLQNSRNGGLLSTKGLSAPPHLQGDVERDILFFLAIQAPPT